MTQRDELRRLASAIASRAQGCYGIDTTPSLVCLFSLHVKFCVQPLVQAPQVIRSAVKKLSDAEKDQLVAMVES